jgi:hypothetical protein
LEHLFGAPWRWVELAARPIASKVGHQPKWLMNLVCM